MQLEANNEEQPTKAMLEAQIRKEFAQKGGRARAKLPKEQLSALGKKAIEERWRKYRAAKEADKLG